MGSETAGSRSRRGHLLLVIGLLAVAGLGWFGWRWLSGQPAAEWKKSPSAGSVSANANVAVPAKGAPPPWLAANRRDPLTGSASPSAAAVDNPNDPRAQHALWTKRLERSQQLLDNYRRVTRYPHESRPAQEHSDQLYPNQPIVEDKRLHKPGDEVKTGVRLRTSQERIFVAGGESVLFTLAAFDDNGNALPLAISAAGIVDPPLGGKSSTRQRLRVAFNDTGAEGDVVGGDGIWSLRFTPAMQGFANYSGQLRLDLTIEAGGQSGFTYFDLYYTPDPPALWTGAVREVIEAGSLHLYLKVQVKEPGRYVATGRFDDVTGKPFALAVFNQELAAGTQEILFRAYGKLVLDQQPALPLRLRDVDGFLLKEDASPDRALMPRLPGLVHMTKRYPLDVFSNAEWQSEERDRYLREYLNDVELAKLKLEELRKRIAGGKAG